MSAFIYNVTFDESEKVPLAARTIDVHRKR